MESFEMINGLSSTEHADIRAVFDALRPLLLKLAAARAPRDITPTEMVDGHGFETVAEAYIDWSGRNPGTSPFFNRDDLVVVSSFRSLVRSYWAKRRISAVREMSRGTKVGHVDVEPQALMDADDHTIRPAVHVSDLDGDHLRVERG